MIIKRRTIFIMLQIKVENLSKKYGKKQIFTSINLLMDNSKINFLIGENGIGKTTFIKCLKNITSYDGYINNDNYEIAYSPDKVSYPDFISVYNFLLLLLKANKVDLKDNKLITSYLKKFGIYKYRNMPIIKLSKGTRQKITLIQTLIQNKEVYIFDEPLSGIDEESKNVFMKELNDLIEKKKLILIITHQINKYSFDNINVIDFNKYV